MLKINNKDFLLIPEVAELTKKHPRTIRRWLKKLEGKIPEVQRIKGRLVAEKSWVLGQTGQSGQSGQSGQIMSTLEPKAGQEIERETGQTGQGVKKKVDKVDKETGQSGQGLKIKSGQSRQIEQLTKEGKGLRHWLENVRFENVALKKDVEHLGLNIKNREKGIQELKEELKEDKQLIWQAGKEMGLLKGRGESLETQIKMLTAPKKRWWQRK